MLNGELKKQLIEERGYYCEECVFPGDNNPLDLHHALLGDRKRYHNVLTVGINCALVCRKCHPYVSNYEWRVKFLRKQVERYGRHAVADWLGNLPDKLKLHKDNLWMMREELK